MRKKLGDFFDREARKMLTGHQAIAYTGDIEKVIRFLVSRVAVVYYEGKADGLEEARDVIHPLTGEEKKDGNV